jgi:hypothetical protein
MITPDPNNSRKDPPRTAGRLRRLPPPAGSTATGEPVGAVGASSPSATATAEPPALAEVPSWRRSPHRCPTTSHPRSSRQGRHHHRSSVYKFMFPRPRAVGARQWAMRGEMAIYKKCFVCSKPVIVGEGKAAWWATNSGDRYAHLGRCHEIMKLTSRDYSKSPRGHRRSEGEWRLAAQAEFRGQHTWKAREVALIDKQGRYRGTFPVAHCDHCGATCQLYPQPPGTFPAHAQLDLVN